MIFNFKYNRSPGIIIGASFVKIKRKLNQTMKRILLMICFAGASYLQAQTIIGTTTYDVQSNNGAKHRIRAYDDGHISAIWTGSTDPTTAFTDRGMFYNHSDGLAWGAAPTTRLETVRTGFGELLEVSGHEVVISHDAAASKIQVNANDAIGSNVWSELSGSDQIRGIWPVAFSPEGTDDIYVVNADTQFITGLNFSRSDDGGLTWTVLNYPLPFLTAADGMPALTNGAENYQVVVHNSDVYVLFGMINSDLRLLHSDDYGNDGSWEYQDIIDFPFDNYTGTVQTDIDGDAVTDTIGTTDGTHFMMVEDDGTVHVFSPYYRIYSDAGAFSWIVNWNAMGLWHWESTMDEAELLDLEIDWINADCTGDAYTGLGASTFTYRNAANISSPTAAIDPVTGRMFVLYAMKVEYTDIYDDPTNFSAQSFRDIFGMFSDDGGATWSAPVNLTNTAEPGEENYYVYAYDRVMGGKIHAIWQQDNEPGIFIEGDPVVTNNIRYAAWDIESFYPTLPTAAYLFVTDIGEVTFTNISEDATGCYFWDFGDGGTSNEVNPVHTYTVAGDYTVCLTAENPYGTDVYCGSINVILPPDAAFTYTGDPVVSFTDLTLNDPTSWLWNFGDGGTSTLQNPVHTFTSESTFTVCLTATNALGFEVYCLPVVIDSTELLVPVADFTFVVAGGTTVNFTDISTNSPNSWAWDFGDGGSSVDQNPSHAFPSASAYEVCLIAGNDFGSDTICKTVLGNAIVDLSSTLNVFPNPAADFCTIQTGNWQPDQIILYTLTGEKLMPSVAQQESGSITLNTADLPAGMYLIELRSDQNVGYVNIVIE